MAVSDATFPWWVTSCKKLRYHFILSRDVDDQRILQWDWTRDKTCQTQPKRVVPDTTFAWWLSSCKKSKRLLDLLLRYWSKNLLPDWTRDTTGNTEPEVIVSDATYIWWLSPCKKSKEETLMIIESCNLIGQEVWLATSNQKWWSRMLPFFDNCLHLNDLEIDWFLPVILIIGDD